MATSLHLLKPDSAPLAASVIEAHAREERAGVLVVLLDGASPPALPGGITVRRLAPGDLDYHDLLDLILAADRVVAW